MSKPTVVLIPGAWHSPSHYSSLLKLIETAGYPTRSLRLPSVASSTPHEITATTDVDFVRNKLLLPLIEEGRDIVLINHSYGGLVGGSAAKGLSKIEQQNEGRTGGIVGLIFIAAFLGVEGADLQTMVGGKLDPRIIIDEVSGQTTASIPIDMFYSDVPSSEQAIAAAAVQQHAYSALTTPFPASGWGDSAFDGRRAYIKAANDNIIPPFVQTMMVDKSGVKWELQETQTGHSPFLSQPAILKNIVVELIEAFEKKLI
ncbi:uncharacterized protein BP5553_10635 [Venustampulla echinocandica]|uniref:AB hydrolase-1 domain-containing protein n=1 Tax=Venustampulla echinocandica TaxID=2656787 RepID=A0A370T947_9HELO|nr:uncharacterized protein BP5553_10635 [Venustampulla echinocandica]RDL30008.1 hypothetical protein BP5553_10635 [Venustampulla echinocandica]